ncbi:hypothetical protein V2J09_015199 [Rumex salicifolius]
MSLGYAEKLSYIEDVGNVGMTEFFDPSHILRNKIEQLAMMIKQSKHLVVFTGAGISTSCGIPDFRGPKGIWTLQREGKALPEASLPFHLARPSVTHMALVELEKASILKFVISQNIDGLHLRSGLPRDKLAELHGDSFMEVCSSCGAEYVRDFEVETIGLKETSRRCSDLACNAKLKDTVLDWEDALPPKEMNPAEKHCKMADLVLCLGTSLQITPACNLPLKCLNGGGKIVIVNLQSTPKDKKASLVIHGLVDQTFLSQALSSDKRHMNWTLRVSSSHGLRYPLPFIKCVEVSFSNRPDLKAATLEKQPYALKRRSVRDTEPFEVILKIIFVEGSGCSSTRITIPVNFKIARRCPKYDKEAIFQKLKDKAMQECKSGQREVIERRANLRPKYDATVYAIVTNIVTYERNRAPPNPPKPISGNGGVKVKIENGNTSKRVKARKRKSSFEITFKPPYLTD